MTDESADFWVRSGDTPRINVYVGMTAAIFDPTLQGKCTVGIGFGKIATQVPQAAVRRAEVVETHFAERWMDFFPVDHLTMNVFGLDLMKAVSEIGNGNISMDSPEICRNTVANLMMPLLRHSAKNIPLNALFPLWERRPILPVWLFPQFVHSCASEEVQQQYCLNFLDGDLRTRMQCMRTEEGGSELGKAVESNLRLFNISTRMLQRMMFMRDAQIKNMFEEFTSQMNDMREAVTQLSRQIRDSHGEPQGEPQGEPPRAKKRKTRALHLFDGSAEPSEASDADEREDSDVEIEEEEPVPLEDAESEERDERDEPEEPEEVLEEEEPVELDEDEDETENEGEGMARGTGSGRRKRPRVRGVKEFTTFKFA